MKREEGSPVTSPGHMRRHSTSPLLAKKSNKGRTHAAGVAQEHGEGENGATLERVVLACGLCFVVSFAFSSTIERFTVWGFWLLVELLGFFAIVVLFLRNKFDRVHEDAQQHAWALIMPVHRRLLSKLSSRHNESSTANNNGLVETMFQLSLEFFLLPLFGALLWVVFLGPSFIVVYALYFILNLLKAFALAPAILFLFYILFPNELQPLLLLSALRLVDFIGLVFFLFILYSLVESHLKPYFYASFQLSSPSPPSSVSPFSALDEEELKTVKKRNSIAAIRSSSPSSFQATTIPSPSVSAPSSPSSFSSSPSLLPSSLDEISAGFEAFALAHERMLQHSNSAPRLHRRSKSISPFKSSSSTTVRESRTHQHHRTRSHSSQQSTVMTGTKDKRLAYASSSSLHISSSLSHISTSTSSSSSSPNVRRSSHLRKSSIPSQPSSPSHQQRRRSSSSSAGPSLSSSSSSSLWRTHDDAVEEQ